MSQSQDVFNSIIEGYSSNQGEFHSLEQHCELIQELKSMKSSIDSLIRISEESIIGVVENISEGTVSHERGDYKISVKFGLRRTIDDDILREIYQDESMLPVLSAVIRSKPVLDLSAYRSLSKTDEDSFLRISAAIRAKPAKTSVTIKKIEE